MGRRNGTARWFEVRTWAELRAVYRAFGADPEEQVTLLVTPNRAHEIDYDDLQAFLAG